MDVLLTIIMTGCISCCIEYSEYSTDDIFDYTECIVGC